MTGTQVPLVDLRSQHERIAEDVRAGFEHVLSETSFVLGPEVEGFEREYAQYCGVAHCVGVGNGTDAIELALRASRIAAGDEVRRNLLFVLRERWLSRSFEAEVRNGRRCGI